MFFFLGCFKNCFLKLAQVIIKVTRFIHCVLLAYPTNKYLSVIYVESTCGHVNVQLS